MNSLYHWKNKFDKIFAIFGLVKYFILVIIICISINAIENIVNANENIVYRVIYIFDIFAVAVYLSFGGSLSCKSDWN